MDPVRRIRTERRWIPALFLLGVGLLPCGLLAPWLGWLGLGMLAASLVWFALIP